MIFGDPLLLAGQKKPVQGSAGLGRFAGSAHGVTGGPEEAVSSSRQNAYGGPALLPAKSFFQLISKV
jgi:hypothetical protein